MRVEGAGKTLLGPTVVETHSGWITKDGTPKGTAWPDTSATGALDVATRHDWGGSN